MGLIGWIVIGLVAGSIAQSVAGVEKRGCLFTLLVGVLGAVVGGALFNAARDGDGDHVMRFNLGSMLVAIVGAFAVSLALRVVGGGKR